MSVKTSPLRRFITTIIVILLLAVLWVYRQEIIDWVRLQGYKPPAEIAQLATDTTMNDQGRKLFYLNHPDIKGKEGFTEACGQGEQTIVLGCYIKNRGIYIYDVDDSRLNGIKQVTAAHEMLHAAYDRLSSSEKQRVDDMLDQAYANVSNDRIRDTIESYRRAGSDVRNELHSILATEVRQLPAGLESYYAKYFTNRSRIVDYSEAYESVFTEKQAEQDRLLSRIDSLKAELASEKQAIDAEKVALRSDYQELDMLARNNQTAEYNSRVPSYNARVSALQKRISEFNRTVELMNDLVNQYNQLGAEQAELYNAIDSRSVPQSY